MTFSYPFVETTTATDWKTWDRYGVEVTGDGRLVLATDPTPAFEPPATLGEPLDDRSIRDLALHECGDLVLLSTAGAVFQYDAMGATATRIDCLGDSDGDTDSDGDGGKAFTEPRAIAFAADTLYVAHGPAGAPRLHAFSRHLFHRRWTLEDGFDDPVALLERDGVLHVLDRGLPSESPASTEETETDAPGFVATLDENATRSVVHRGLGDVVDFAADDRGWLYVLVRTQHDPEPRFTLRVFDADDDAVEGWGVLPSEAFPTHEGRPLDLSCLAASLDGSLLVGVAAPVAEGGGLYRLARPVADDTDVNPAFARLPTVNTGCARVQLDERLESDESDGARDHVEGVAYLVRVGEESATDRVVVSLVRTRRNLPSVGGPGRFVGRAVTRFDAGTPETVWHRIQTVVEATDPGTRVRLRYVAVDAPLPDSGETEADDEEGTTRGRPVSVTTPAHPEGFERIPTLSPAVAQRLREANVLGVTGLATLSVGDVLGLVESLDEPVSSTTARRWIQAARTLAAQWVSLPVTPPTDALLDEGPATGGSLWVELELLGDEFASPVVESFRAYFPRESYLQYLPAIYREDPESAAFLTRFLSLFERTYVGMEAEFAGLSRYFDANGVPAENLGWLAEWVGRSLDEGWSEETRRAVLAQATQLSKSRGTREGLTTLVELLLEDVTERSLDSAWAVARDREKQTLDALAAEGHVDDVDAALDAHAALEADYDEFLRERVHLWEYDDFDCVDTAGARATFDEVLRCPQCFVVLVRAAATAEQWRAIRRTVAAETPAHAVGDVVALDSRIEVGTHTYLGVNSVVSDGTFLVESASLGRASTLTAREPRGHLDIGARLGVDARLS